MKRLLLILTFIFAFFISASFAQKQITPVTPRDPVMEADAKHNLEVSWQYFKLKKAYKAVLMRFEETFETYPEFSKMDEYLYLAGMSCVNLSNGKGKQKVSEANLSNDEKTKYTPEMLKQNALLYFTMIKDKYPTSRYIKDAEKQLEKLK